MSIETIDILAVQIRDIQKACTVLKTYPASEELITRAITALESLLRLKRRQLTTIIHDHAETVRPNRNRRAANDAEFEGGHEGHRQAETGNRWSSETQGLEPRKVHGVRPVRASEAGLECAQ